MSAGRPGTPTTGRALRVVAALGAVASLVALAIGIAMPARATEATGTFHVGAPERSLMKNGLTVMVLSRPGLPLVQMQMQFPSGSIADPPGKEGLASLTAALLSRGTARHAADAFAEQVEFLGGALDATALLERNTVAGEFASRDFEAGVGLMAEMVREPAFADAEFDRERGLALARVESLADDPEALAGAAFARWLWGTHPYGRPREGTVASLKALTRADVVAFHRTQYVPGGAILILSGDITAARARPVLEKAFGSWRGAAAKSAAVAPAPPFSGRRVLLVEKPDATQSQILLGNLAMRRADPAFEALSVANSVLGSGFTSRLVDEVRVKRGLTYSIHSSVGAGRAAGSLEVSTFSKNETAVETLGLVIDLMRRMRADGPSAAEVETGRNYVAGLYPLRIEAPDSLAGEMLDVEFYGLGKGYIDGYQGRIRGVTLEQARAAATRFVPADDLAITVVGPRTLAGPLATFGPVTVKPAAWVTSGSD